MTFNLPLRLFLVAMSLTVLQACRKHKMDDGMNEGMSATIPVGDKPVAAWVGYDGKMYVDNEDGQTVSVIDVATNTVVQTINLGFMPGSVAHNRLKKEVWATDQEGGKAHYCTWNEFQNTWVHGGAFNKAMGAHATAFTKDGSVAYVTSQLAGNVSVIDVTTHTRLKDMPVGKKPYSIVIKN